MSDDYDAEDDFRQSIAEAFRVIRERVARGGPGWEPHRHYPLEADRSTLPLLLTISNG